MKSRGAIGALCVAAFLTVSRPAHAQPWLGISGGVGVPVSGAHQWIRTGGGGEVIAEFTSISKTSRLFLASGLWDFSGRGNTDLQSLSVIPVEIGLKLPHRISREFPYLSCAVGMWRTGEHSFDIRFAELRPSGSLGVGYDFERTDGTRIEIEAHDDIGDIGNNFFRAEGGPPLTIMQVITLRVGIEHAARVAGAHYAPNSRPSPLKSER